MKDFLTREIAQRHPFLLEISSDMLEAIRPMAIQTLDSLNKAYAYEGIRMSEGGFAQRLRLLRKQKNWSQSDLAERVGLHYNHLGRFERGSSRPGSDTLRKLAQSLGVSTDYLLYGSTEDAAKADFEDRELLRLFQQVEQFEAQEKAIIKELIDAFVKKKQLIEMAGAKVG